MFGAGIVVALVAATLSTCITIGARIWACVTSAPWITHLAGFLTAVTVLAWVVVIAQYSVSRIVDHLHRIERRLDVKDLEAARDASVSQIRRT